METTQYEIIELSIANYWGGNCWARFDFTTGLVELMKSEENRPFVEGKSDTITQPFNPERLQAYIMVFYPERWLPEYVNSGILDGTQWELKIQYNGGIKSRTYGSNDWPKRDGTSGGYPGELFNLALVGLNRELNKQHFDF